MIAKSQSNGEISPYILLNNCFHFGLTHKKEEKVLTVNPELNDKKLDELTVKTRESNSQIIYWLRGRFSKRIRII